MAYHFALPGKVFMFNQTTSGGDISLMQDMYYL